MRCLKNFPQCLHSMESCAVCTIRWCFVKPTRSGNSRPHSSHRNGEVLPNPLDALLIDRLSLTFSAIAPDMIEENNAEILKSNEFSISESYFRLSSSKIFAFPIEWFDCFRCLSKFCSHLSIWFFFGCFSRMCLRRSEFREKLSSHSLQLMLFTGFLFDAVRLARLIRFTRLEWASLLPRLLKKIIEFYY